MGDWLDNFGNGQLYVTEGEKMLMRFAMDKERQRIVRLLDAQIGLGHCDFCNYDMEGCEIVGLIALIKGETE